MPHIYAPNDDFVARFWQQFLRNFGYNFTNLDLLKTALTISDKTLPDLEKTGLMGDDAIKLGVK